MSAHKTTLSNADFQKLLVLFKQENEKVLEIVKQENQSLEGRLMGTIKQENQNLERQMKADITTQLTPIKKTLDQHTQVLDKHTREFASIKKTLQKHTQMHTAHHQDLNSLIEDHDPKVMHHERRLKRIEKTLDLAPLPLKAFA